MTACRHCGTEFLPATADEEFCCHGCAFVHRVIQDEGFDRFYDLKGGSQSPPVNDRPFRPQNLAWLEPILQSASRTTPDHPRATFHLGGLSCVGCVWLVEKLFLRHPGARRARVFPATAEVELEWDSDAQADPVTEFAQELPRFGYALGPLQDDRPRQRESRRLLSRLGLCGAFALNAMGFTLPRYFGMEDSFAFAGLFDLIALLSATLALLVGGTYFFQKSYASLRQGTLHIDLPISLGLILAYAGSLMGWLLGARELLYFDFVATFTFLMLGGRFLHLTAAEKAQASLRGENALPRSVELNDGTRKSVRDLVPGDLFRLAPGDSAPVASVLAAHPADFSLAWMTGEPDPQTFQPGRRVPSGALNVCREHVVLKADESYDQSLAASLVAKVDREESSPLLARVLKIYLGLVLLVGFLGGLLWLPVGIVPAMQVVLAVLVVSCPCALGVAIPLADRRAALFLEKVGVFVQNPGIWSRFRKLRHLLFDKTGTLTLERPTLTNSTVLDELPARTQATLATLTSQSLHPLARTLHEETVARLPDGSPPPAGRVTEIPGQGLQLEQDGHRWFLGKPSADLDDAPNSTSHRGPVTVLSCDHRPIASFQFDERPRDEAQDSLREVRQTLGLSTHILSGDEHQRVLALAHELEFDPACVHGNLSPDQKAALVRDLPHSLYLGDGANDALAFDQADVTGTPLADRSLLDRKADFLFTHPGLRFLPTLFGAARWRQRTVLRVLLFAITYNLAAVTLCLAGLMTPLLAALLMPLSSLASLALASTPVKAGRAAPSPRGSSALSATSSRNPQSARESESRFVPRPEA